MGKAITLPHDFILQVAQSDRKEFLSMFRHCWSVRKEFVTYFEKELAKLDVKMESEECYNSPNMVPMQSSITGEKRGIKKVLKLLKEGIFSIELLLMSTSHA